MVTSRFFGNVGETENFSGIFRTQRFDQVEMSPQECHESVLVFVVLVTACLWNN